MHKRVLPIGPREPADVHHISRVDTVKLVCYAHFDFKIQISLTNNYKYLKSINLMNLN
jgi:hypothetical protein